MDLDQDKWPEISYGSPRSVFQQSLMIKSMKFVAQKGDNFLRRTNALNWVHFQ